jgi:ABC-2 type transport system ATP-binding protein
MGERKAIIFSTHILEEVEEVCTRAIIIDRGRIVANGTPPELKARSERAGAVSFTLLGASGEAVRSGLATLSMVSRSEILLEEQNRVALRAYPVASGAGAGAVGAALAAALAELAVRESWKIEQLLTEEGRLDEVFRSITWSETASQVAHRHAAEVPA